jgi:hypothetical protein
MLNNQIPPHEGKEMILYLLLSIICAAFAFVVESGVFSF